MKVIDSTFLLIAIVYLVIRFTMNVPTWFWIADLLFVVVLVLLVIKLILTKRLAK